MNYDDDNLYAAVVGLFIMGIVWSGVAGWYSGLAFYEWRQDGAAGFGVGFSVAITLIIVDWLGLAAFENRRDEAQREAK